MGLFTSKSRSERESAAKKWAADADEETAMAREEARKAAAYRKRLASGKSDDPAADRYLLKQHDENRRIAEANARDCKATAEQLRRRF